MRRITGIAAMLLSGCAASGGAPANSAAVGAEKRVSVCVVDTIAPGGMMTLSAIHVLSTNDTLVLQANGRVPIEETTAGPRVWTKGAIQLRTTAGPTNFNPSGQPRVQVPGKIALLGVARGLPIFANPADVAGIRPEIEALAASGTDLEKALNTRLNLRRRMANIKTIYAPTSLVNCAFQTFTRPTARRR